MTRAKLPILVAAIALAACGGNSTGEVQYSIARAPTSGNDQIGVSSTTLANPLNVKVFDANGQPAAGVLVGWAVTHGSITDTSRTDAGGIASATWILGDAPAARADTAYATVPGGGTSTAIFYAYTFSAGTYVVKVTNNAFAPSNLAVLAGSRVAWIWLSDAVGHNVEPVGGSGPPSSSGPPRDGPFVFQASFPDAGTFNYQCATHGASGMTGRVVVSAGPPPAPGDPAR